MGRDPPASIDQRTDRCRKLNRCDLKGLAKGYRCQFDFSHVFHLVHDRSGFSRKIYTGFRQKAKLFKVFIITFHPQPQPHFNKHGVTGVLSTLHEILGSVPDSFRTVDAAVLHDLITRTVELVIRRNDAFFQSG